MESKCESSELDFKAQFDPANKGDWCELIKDIVAMANTGGGIIIVGANDDGDPSGFDCSAVLNTDIALFVDQLYKYTDVHFAQVSLRSVQREGVQAAEVLVGAAESLLAFKQAGNYAAENGKQKNAFLQGTVYVRHGPKSEPATTEDIRAFMQKRIEVVRTEILGNLRKVVEAPEGSVVSVGVPVEAASGGGLDRVRLVADANAPGVVLMDPNKTHPYRLKDVVSEVNRLLGGGIHVSVHDILGMRRLYQMDANRSYRYKPNTGSGQYSDAFVQWIVNQLKADDNFLIQLRARHHEWVINHNGRAREVAPPVLDRGNRLSQEAN